MKLDNDLFPFEYNGGGYFRKKGVPQGVRAETLHGPEIPRYMFNRLEPLITTMERALTTIVESDQLNTGSFVCDFQTLQNVASHALADVSAMKARWSKLP